MEKPWFKFYPENVPPSIDYPQVALPKLLDEAAEKYPENVAIVFEGFKITFKKLRELVDRFASALNGLGVKKGDVVAIFMPNLPQFVISYYGTLKIGGVVTALSPLYKEREAEYQLNNSEAETVVVLDLLYPIIKNVWEKTKIKRVIVTSISEYLPSAKKFLGKLFKKNPSLKISR